MRRFHPDLLTPYIRDVVAFAVLGASIATVFAVATANRTVEQASVTYSVTTSDYATSL